MYVTLAVLTPAVRLFLASLNAVLSPKLKASSRVLKRESTSAINQGFLFGGTVLFLKAAALFSPLLLESARPE